MYVNFFLLKSFRLLIVLDENRRVKIQKEAFSFKRILRHLTKVQLNISDVPFVQNNDYQYRVTHQHFDTLRIFMWTIWRGD